MKQLFPLQLNFGDISPWTRVRSGSVIRRRKTTARCKALVRDILAARGVAFGKVSGSMREVGTQSWFYVTVHKPRVACTNQMLPNQTVSPSKALFDAIKRDAAGAGIEISFTWP